MYDWQPNVYFGTDSERFALGKTGNNILLILCVNPSTATNKVPDQTARQVEKIAKNNGFNGWIIFNIYPKRFTNPSNLPHIPNKELHIKNLTKIKEIVINYKSTTIWAAWGNVILKRKYLTEFLKDIFQIIKEYNLSWKCAGQTKIRNPRHPSRLSNNTQLKNFDIENYIRKLF